MKREFQIAVRIDDQDKHHAGPRTQQIANDKYEVIIPDNQPWTQFSLENILAHELGHIVSKESGNAVQGLRFLGAPLHAKAIIETEEEAWKVAEKIRFNGDKAIAMKTYYDNFGYNSDRYISREIK